MINVFKNHLKILYDRIEEVESYIDLVEKQEEVVTEIKDKDNAELVITNEYVEMLIKLKSSRVNYNAIIISLYGCFENFIDDILKDYLKFVIKLNPIYENLDKKIKDKFLKEATDFLSNPQRFVNYDLKVVDVVEDLYRCIKEDNCTKMNLNLILKHPGNLKIEQISNLFADVGIANSINQIKKSEKYISYYMSDKNIDFESAKNLLANEENELVFSVLTDLVERRNSVSHRWDDDDRISLPDIKTKHIKYIKVLCDCICELICLRYLDEIFKQGELKQLNNIIKVYNHYVLCINSEESRLQKGGILYIIKNGQTCLADILNIRHNQEDVEQAIDNVDIGLKLSIRVKEQYQFYYIK